MTPQLLLTLSPSGELQIERHLNGMRQKIDIEPGTLESTCKRILHAQLERETRLGDDGLPTESQIRHWERHSQFPSYTCPHCIAEGIIHKPHTRKSQSINLGNGVTVRHLRPRGLDRHLTSKSSASDIGL